MQNIAYNWLIELIYQVEGYKWGVNLWKGSMLPSDKEAYRSLPYSQPSITAVVIKGFIHTGSVFTVIMTTLCLTSTQWCLS